MVLSDVHSIFVGALVVLQRKMKDGSSIAFMNSFWRAVTTLIAVFKHWAELQSHGATVHRITQFLHGHETSHFDVCNAAIAMNVGFAYEGADVLRDVSVAWRPGRRVLITGDNESGKTTFANILARCLYPTQGRVSLPSRISAATLPLAFPPLKVGQLGVEQRLLQSFSLDCPEIRTAYLAARNSCLSKNAERRLSLCTKRCGILNSSNSCARSTNARVLAALASANCLNGVLRQGLWSTLTNASTPPTMIR
jgi:ATP-binding cassette subfamily B protein